MIINAVGEIEWQNDAAIRLLGVCAQQDIGRRLTHLIRHPAFTACLVVQGYLEPVEFPSPLGEHLKLRARVVPYGDING
ncbi:MAG TPA: hypothetical protein VHK27_01355 [Gammaproteobacteria bacterium]|nr:hypothetical protein [Gammaproteobacteria bacterium]